MFIIMMLRVRMKKIYHDVQRYRFLSYHPNN